MKYGFIGCGHMGSAIVSRLKSKDVAVSDRSGNAKKLAEELGIRYLSPAEIAENCDCIFLAIKPQMMAEVIESIATTLQRRKPLLITMAAGITMQSLGNMTGTALPIIRIMPNTPVAVGSGMTLYCTNAETAPEDLASFLEDMADTGTMEAIPESLIDAAGVLSGCGPAYLYMLAEAMADGAVACGVPRDKAVTCAAAAMTGAGQMLLQPGASPGPLKDAVCSPGGSTIAGVSILEERGFRGAVIDCIKAAFQKNQDLGK